MENTKLLRIFSIYFIWFQTLIHISLSAEKEIDQPIVLPRQPVDTSPAGMPEASSPDSMTSLLVKKYNSGEQQWVQSALCKSSPEHQYNFAVSLVLETEKNIDVRQAKKREAMGWFQMVANSATTPYQLATQAYDNLAVLYLEENEMGHAFANSLLAHKRYDGKEMFQGAIFLIKHHYWHEALLLFERAEKLGDERVAQDIDRKLSEYPNELGLYRLLRHKQHNRYFSEPLVSIINAQHPSSCTLRNEQKTTMSHYCN
jgi:hypothetical protein